MKFDILDHLSEHISTGLVLARKKYSPKDTEKYKYKVFTLKSFNESGYIDEEYLDDFESGQIIDSKFIAQKDDIVIRLSSPNTAIYITKELEGIVIPSLFVCIRLKENRNLLPQFVQIYLNSDKGRKNYKPDIIGGLTYVLKATSLRQIKIPFYDIEKQRQAIYLNNLMLREKLLLNKLVQEKEIYHKEVMNKILE